MENSSKSSRDKEIFNGEKVVEDFFRFFGESSNKKEIFNTIEYARPRARR